MMYFRFGAALLIVVAIALVGVAIEKTSLARRREISSQEYQLDVLRDEHARLRLRTQELGAPAGMLNSIRDGKLSVQRPIRSATNAKSLSGGR